MQIKEEKKTREVVETITTYIANDGTTFKKKEDCLAYEESAECTAFRTLNELGAKYVEGNAALELFPFASEDCDKYVLICPQNEREVNLINTCIKALNKGDSMNTDYIIYTQIGQPIILYTDYGYCGYKEVCKSYGPVEEYYNNRKEECLARLAK